MLTSNPSPRYPSDMTFEITTRLGAETVETLTDAYTVAERVAMALGHPYGVTIGATYIIAHDSSGNLTTEIGRIRDTRAWLSVLGHRVRTDDNYRTVPAE